MKYRKKNFDYSLLEETINPNNYTSFLDLSTIFNNNNPIVVEIGCGNGHYLIDQAINNPNNNFIGIDLKDYRIVKCRRKQLSVNIQNINWICGEAFESLERLFNNLSINKILMTFPDPWPKKRHHKNRLFTKKFIDLIYLKLTTSGVFIFISDHNDYYKWCLDILKDENRFSIIEDYIDPDLEKSTFAEIWKSENRLFYSFKLEKL